MAEVAAFPILAEALRPLISGGTINTEAVFEAGLGYMLAGMRQSLEAKKSGARRRRYRVFRSRDGFRNGSRR